MIEITTSADVTVISFSSASISSVSDTEQIGRQLRQFVTQNQPKKVVIDFCGVKFFASQMLGLLVEVWRKLKDYGGVMLISGINPQLGRVFKITNLDKIFEFYPDKEIALDVFKKR